MKSKNTSNKLDWILIIGVVLAPMTGLRIWKVGPGEILVLIWCLINSFNNNKIKFPTYHLTFWVQFLLTILIGTFIGVIIAPDEVIPSQVLTYMYLMIISLGIYLGLIDRDIGEIEKLLGKISIFGTLWYLFLYIYSLVVAPNFFNAPLWYGNIDRFSGGGTNPHQLAVFIGAIIFVCYRNFLISKGGEKVLNIILVIIGLFIANSTRSSTLVMSIVGTALLAFIMLPISKLKKNRDKMILLSSFFVIGSTLVLINISTLLSRFLNWIESDPNGMGRLEIFSTINESLSKSLLFGLGPGNHAFGGIMEYHNTYLEILAMCGVVGFSIFIIYNFNVIKKISIDYTLVLIILPLFMYGLAGFAMRRLVYWVIFMFVVVLGEKLREEKVVTNFLDN